MLILIASAGHHESSWFAHELMVRLALLLHVNNMACRTPNGCTRLHVGLSRVQMQSCSPLQMQLHCRHQSMQRNLHKLNKAELHVSSLSAGVQLAKMTPFRSFVATMSMALAPIFMYSLHLEGGLANYASVCILSCNALSVTMPPSSAIIDEQAVSALYNSKMLCRAFCQHTLHNRPHKHVCTCHELQQQARIANS